MSQLNGQHLSDLFATVPLRGRQLSIVLYIEQLFYLYYQPTNQPEPGCQSNPPQSARVTRGTSVKSVFWIWSLRPGCSKVSWDLWNGTIVHVGKKNQANGISPFPFALVSFCPRWSPLPFSFDTFDAPSNSGLLYWESTGDWWFPSQQTSNAERVPTNWCHPVKFAAMQFKAWR